MEIQITFKHVDHSESLKNYAVEKSEKLNRYLHGKLHLVWTFDKEGGDFTAHVHVTGNHIDFFAESRANEAYATVDMVIAKIEKQIKKHKEIISNE